MVYSAKKRFVAGAVCPRCQAMDKIVVFSQDGRDYRECVACDYHEEMRFATTPRELDTRVNQTEQDKDSGVQVINIMPISKN